MKNEAEFKTAFKRSVSFYKGASISLAAPVLPGIPDMYVILPNYMPVLLEAKWLGSIPRAKFKRKLQFSPMQLSYANKLNAVQPFAMMGLIGLIYNKITYCVLTPIHPTENYLESTFFADYNRATRQEGRFDVKSLFERSPIPLLEPTNGRKSLGSPEPIHEGVLSTFIQTSIANSDQLAVPGQAPA